MKKILLAAVVLAGFFTSYAQSEKFTGAMKKNISLLDSAFSNPDAFLELANTFERIGTAEKNQWLPYYYAAYCRANYVLMQKDPSGNDQLADKTTELINKADSLQPNNSEISVLKSMNATARMMVNPMQRYMQYGATIEKELTNAMMQDATNPRPNLIKGQNLKYTPEQFGGGCKTAKAELETAIAKFNAFKSASDISPNWGRAYAETLVKDCK